MNAKHLLVALASVVSITTASAFDIDGIKSGMTIQELTSHAARLGLEVHHTDGFNYFMGKLDKYQIDGSFVVCSGRVVSYAKSVDFDADYPKLLIDTIQRLGQPKVVATRRQLQQSTTMIPAVEMIWRDKQDRVNLSFSTEVRDGKGALKMNRGANLQYVAPNTCITQPWTRSGC